MKKILRDLKNEKLINFSQYLHELNQIEIATQVSKFIATITYAIREF